MLLDPLAIFHKHGSWSGWLEVHGETLAENAMLGLTNCRKELGADGCDFQMDDGGDFG